jgi:hypothetical protein
VLLDQVLQPPLLQVLQLVLLHVQDDLGATPQLLALGVVGDGEGAARLLTIGSTEPTNQLMIQMGEQSVSWVMTKEPPGVGENGEARQLHSKCRSRPMHHVSTTPSVYQHSKPCRVQTAACLQAAKRRNSDSQMHCTSCTHQPLPLPQLLLQSHNTADHSI